MTEPPQGAVASQPPHRLGCDVRAVLNGAPTIGLDVGEYLDMPGYEPTDAMLRWTDDGSGMIVYHRDSLPAPVYRLDMATGQRSELLSLMPTDAAGIRGIETLSLVQDGRYYAYNYTRQLDVLYVIQGLED